MKLILNDFVSDELSDYLLSQKGILNVNIDNSGFLSFVTIQYDKEVTPLMIMKYIELFQAKEYSILFGFDKNYCGSFGLLKYIIKDMCCEYCYRGFVRDLFYNDKIKSVRSNFDFRKPAFNIEFIIEYDKNCDEQEIIDYINDKNKQ